MNYPFNKRENKYNTTHNTTVDKDRSNNRWYRGLHSIVKVR